MAFREVGDFKSSESAYLRSIVMMESINGRSHPDVGKILNDLAGLFIYQRRFSEAERLLQRALTIFSFNGIEDSGSIGNLAICLEGMGRFRDAEPLLVRALSIDLKMYGAKHPEVAKATHNLASYYLRVGELNKADEMFVRALKATEDALGPKSLSVATILNNMAITRITAGENQSAEGLLLRSLKIRESLLGESHPELGQTLNLLALYYRDNGKYQSALKYARRGTQLYREWQLKANEDSADVAMMNMGGYVRHIQLLSSVLKNSRDARVVEEAFYVAQLIQQSKTEHAMAQMAVRASAGDVLLAEKARDYQDAIAARQHYGKQLMEEVSMANQQHNADKEQDIRKRLSTASARISQLDAELQRDFPAYRELTSSEPIALSDAQRLLSSDEALIAWLVNDKEILLFLVRLDRSDFVKVDVGRERLTQLVKKLRTATELPAAGDPLPFPHEQAHELYEQLFGPIEKNLAGIKHLILVPDGPLQSLSFSMLKVGAGEMANESAPWLARRYALTTLPAITSLRALRKFAKTPGQREPFVGFGDPDLKGGSGDTRGVKIARLFARGLIADTRAVAEMQPLPETANELKSIAKSLKADANSIYLRQAATESAVKKIPLSKYRTVAFATHGIMAGEFKGVQEPALVLTPPTEGTEEDDGLLTASEVAGLKLDADWVILSACNTAAPDGTPGAQGFSGLTKAFFYAGARSLLVSHWAVESNSAMKLTTRMFEEIEKGATKSEALRRSMMALADDPETSHPAFWAPFVVVGEGAR
jgi:CHAT domain-containing protein